MVVVGVVRVGGKPSGRTSNPERHEVNHGPAQDYKMVCGGVR